MAIDSSAPVLTSIDATSPNYGAPQSSQLVAYNQYGMQTIWAGAGGTFEIRPYGALLSAATLTQPGFLYLYRPGEEYITLDLTGGTGVEVDVSGRNFIISVAPNTTVQQVITLLDGNPIGAPSSTLNFVPGANIGISASSSGAEATIEISSSGANGSAAFVITEADASLPNATNLGAAPFTTGLLKNTVSGGVGTLSTAVANTDYMQANSNMVDLYAVQPSAGSLFYYVGGHWVALAPSSTDGDVLTTVSPGTLGWTAKQANLTASLTTLNASPSILLSIAIPTNGVVTLSGEINAANSGYSDFTGGSILAVAGSTAGVATLVSTPLVVVMASSTAIFNVQISGSNLQVVVTGIAATTYNWNISYNVQSN